MFNINHLKGNTYYIDGPTNIGLYKLNERDCVLMDTCFPGPMTQKLLDTLDGHNLFVKAILNTHGHIDHSGSNKWLRDKYECLIGAPSIESIFMEHPELSSLFIFQASPLTAMKSSFSQGVPVDILLDRSPCIIEDIQFHILSLKGHSPNQVGIITPDSVIFVGDTFLGEDALKQAKILYHYNTDLAISSMESLSQTSFDIYVPSHGTPLFDIHPIVELNIKTIETMTATLHQLLCKGPLTTDKIMEILVSTYGITQQLVPYSIGQACVLSLLSFLENKGKVEPFFHNDILHFIGLQI